MGKMISRRFREALESAKRSPVHWAERVKLSFAVSLEQRRRAVDLSYSELAKRLETSPAYVTKVFRGDSNLTIETMVKLAIATDSEIDIRLVEAGSARASWNISNVTIEQSPKSATANSFSFVSVSGGAANHNRFNDLVAA